ncbi:MAG: hypothetical protein M5R36_27455 [Deltaproteobacteria bacterium]|nr:hypothetical protein [Deltaproteobacteria bacterium]
MNLPRIAEILFDIRGAFAGSAQEGFEQAAREQVQFVTVEHGERGVDSRFQRKFAQQAHAERVDGGHVGAVDFALEVATAETAEEGRAVSRSSRRRLFR